MADLNLKLLTEFGNSKSSVVKKTATRIGWRLAAVVLMAAGLTLNQAFPDAWRMLFGMLILSGLAVVMMRSHIHGIAQIDSERYLFERVVWATAIAAIFGVQIGNLALNSGAAAPLQYLFLAPIVAMGMLVSALTNPSLGLSSLSMTVVMLGISGVLPPGILTAAWLSGAVATHIVNPMKQRSDLLRALSLLFAAQIIISGSITAISNLPLVEILESAVWAAVAAVFATSIFWLGVAFLEKLFGIVSDWTLLELCSPEQPALRELVLRAPGTWAHSVGVANLAESAAREVNANPLLCRTMAYYHDIGKSLRPNFFIENQLDGNIHDDLSPALSAQVIASHVSDGVDIARKNKLPQIIIDSIEQHHGTSLITYFFARAQQDQTSDSEVCEEKYRYPGPKPHSKEIAILHLADKVEAASRVHKNSKDLEEFIFKLAESSRADGQLDEAEITYKEVHQICVSFAKSLTALRHDRIEYPKAVTSDASSHDSTHNHSQ